MLWSTMVLFGCHRSIDGCVGGFDQGVIVIVWGWGELDSGPGIREHDDSVYFHGLGVKL